MKRLALFLAVTGALALPHHVYAFACAAYTSGMNDNVGQNNEDAQSFTVSAPCVIDSATFSFNTYTSGISLTSVKIYSDNSGLPSGTVLDTCTPPASGGTGTRTYTCSGNVTLNPSTVYWASFVDGASNLRFNLALPADGSAPSAYAQYWLGSWNIDSYGRSMYLQIDGHAPSGGGGGGGGTSSSTPSLWTGIASSTCLAVGSATVCMTDAPAIPTAGDSMRNLFYSYVLYLGSFFGTVWLLRKR